MKHNIDEYILKFRSKITKDIKVVFSYLNASHCKGKLNNILIEGAPGIGKSVLLKQISYMWANGEILSDKEFLFLLYLRDPIVQQMDSLHDVLCHFFENLEETEQFSRLKKSDGKSVVFLLDGYDELPINLRQSGLIAHFLQRKIFPNSVIVISSRPHATAKLRDDAICRVEILGFSEEDQAHYIQEMLKGDEEKILQIKKHCEIHPTVGSLFYVPFHMTAFLFVYKRQQILIPNSTVLYNLFIIMTICGHLAKCGKTLEEEIKSIDSLPEPYGSFIYELSRFAFLALCKNQLVFHLKEIKDCCKNIADYPNGFGLLQAVEYFALTSTGRSFNFIHLSVQEFLAAHYISKLSKDEEYSILEKYFLSDVHFNMFNFYVALTKGQSCSFKQFLCCGDNTISIHNKFLEDKLQCLRLYRTFYEADDKQMCYTIEKKFTDDNELDLIDITLLPNTLLDAAILLTCSSIKNWDTVNLTSCHIQDDGVRQLHRILKHNIITIENLYLNNNDLNSSSDSYLSEIIISCEVKVLNISDNKTIGETDNFTVLSDKSTQIERLYMHDNRYSSSKWAVKLIQSLKENKTLRLLWIGGNRITDEICDVTCDVLHNNTTLEELYISYNDISAETSKKIVISLNNNNSLKVLSLPVYPDDIIKEIALLQNEVIKKRKCHGCNLELVINHSNW